MRSITFAQLVSSSMLSIALMVAAPACAQSPDAGQASAADTVLHIGDTRTTGSQSAKAAVVEFGDFECSYCGDYFGKAGEQIRSNFVETGKVRFAYRHFPLPMHEHAMEAAKASQCAAQQGQFWVMHNLLFRNQQALAIPNLRDYAKLAGLDMTKFDDCLKSQATQQTINADMEKAKALGVSATPTVIIGTVQADGSVKAEKTISGSQPYETYAQAINEILNRSGAGAAAPTGDVIRAKP